ncbi:peptidase S41 [Labrys sp. WJW]|uniref:peptidase S41 n=1 Tax=Labrys sp. WJW TaxID=1737983 RepID=UPI000834A02F|nr:peptidase S41 [Labrys sp. WJW]OCC02873.1 peptidase S41 [Labrys sp. WJW]
MFAPMAGHAGDIELQPQQMREDLAFLKQRWAPLDKSFSDEQRQAFSRRIEETETVADKLTPEDFALDVMGAVALAGNGHTNANVAAYLGPDLPIRAWWFADGLFIVKTHPAYGHLLGARIDKIGVLSAEQALQQVEPYLAGVRQRRRFLAPGYLVNPRILKKIGATDTASAIPFTVRLADGSTQTPRLEAVVADPGDERRSGLNRGYSVLIPDAKDLPDRWLHILDAKTDLSPLYSKRGDVKAFMIQPSGNTLYIRNDTVASVDDTPLAQKLSAIVRDEILAHKPKHVIVDLRLNNGGDFFNTILFAQALPRLLPEDGRIFVLVSRATFSAGIVTAAMIKGAGGGKVVFIGESMGDAGQFWAEGRKMTLPHSKITVRYSDQFEDYEKGCTDTRNCYWATVAFGPRGISLAPDMAIDVAFADYAAGRDPVLAKALELAR